MAFQSFSGGGSGSGFPVNRTAGTVDILDTTNSIGVSSQANNATNLSGVLAATSKVGASFSGLGLVALGDGTDRWLSVFSGTSVADAATQFALKFDITNRACIASPSDTAVPVPSATFAVDSFGGAKGFLLPLMANETGITTPAKGLVVFDTTANKIKVYNGTAWETVSSA